MVVCSQTPDGPPRARVTTPLNAPTPSKAKRPAPPADEPALEPKWPAPVEYPGLSKNSEIIERQEDEKFIQLARESETAYRAGAFAKALELLRAAEKIKSKSFDIKFLIGAALTELGKHEEGVAAFQQAVALDGERAEGRAGLCGALNLAARRSEAIEECREAVRLKPDLPTFRAQLAELYTLDDRIYEAIELLDAVAAHANNSLFVLGRTGDLYFQMGEHERAAAVYERIAEQWPDVPLSHLRLSAVYDYLGRAREAIASAKKFAELEPDLAFAHFNLGKRLKDAGFFDESISALLKATSLDPTSGAAYAVLSESYEAIGDKTNTLGSLEHAYKHLPPDVRTAFRLGRALTSYGRMADAVEPLERANKLEPARSK